MTEKTTVVSPLTGASFDTDDVVAAGDYSLAWVPDAQMWTVTAPPRPEEMAGAYQSSDAGELSRRNFRAYAEQSVEILREELSRAGISSGEIRSLSFFDYGCGGGHFVVAAEHLGFEAMGMELDSTSVMEARVKGLKVIEGMLPAALAKLDGRRFDVIKVSHVLEHVSNLKELLECLASLLVDRGTLIVNVPDQASFPSRMKVLLRNFGIKRSEYGYVQPPIHLHGFTPSTFPELARIFGLKLVAVYGYSPLDSRHFPTTPDYWRGMGLQHLVYLIGRAIGSGGYMTAILRK